jgi:hypothetical protein
MSPSASDDANLPVAPAPPTLPARVLLLSRPGCHLCDDARDVVARVTAELGERFAERDITQDPALLAEHGESIPVVIVDGVQVDYWRVSEPRLRAALARR